MKKRVRKRKNPLPMGKITSKSDKKGIPLGKLKIGKLCTEKDRDPWRL